MIPDTSIVVGESVRSYDFPEYLEMPGAAGHNIRGCYVDGVVEAICYQGKVPNYLIKIQSSIYQGKPYIYDPPRIHITIPVNGTINKTLRRTHQHVVRK